MRTGSLATSMSLNSMTFRSLAKIFINFPGLYFDRVFAENYAVLE